MTAVSAIPLPEPPPGRGPRYSASALPPYRYVPGVQPHPVRDPAGHSYIRQAKLAAHAPWTPDAWLRLDRWRYGIDLFNQFYFWEAHEAWEDLWASTERGAAPSLLLQGLIQIAAALLKTHLGAIDGVRRLSAEGIDKLERARQQHDRLMGLDLGAVIAAFEAYFEPLRDGHLPRIDAAVPVLRLTEEV